MISIKNERHHNILQVISAAWVTHHDTGQTYKNKQHNVVFKTFEVKGLPLEVN